MTKHSQERNINLELLLEVEKCIPKLRNDKAYTLKDICSDQFWSSTPRNARKTMGETFFTIVKKGHFDLMFIGKNTSNQNLYRLKTTNNYVRFELGEDAF